MIIKGKSRAGPRPLAAHLSNAEKNERVEIVESRGTVATDLRGALVEMAAVASGTRCENPIYHAAISPSPPYVLTPAQCMEAVDALEKTLGLNGHARIVVIHQKLGREHIHVAWSRIDIKRMVSVSDSHNYRKHEEVARDLERRFGHPRVQGAHHEREGVPRPDRTPSRAELQQQERTGITGKAVKAEVTAIFKVSDGPEAFKAALEERGYLLAQGDRRDFVIVDRLGGVHSLVRRIDGMKAADLRDYMAPIDRQSLPKIEQAKGLQEDRRNGHVPARDDLKWENALAGSAIEKAKADEKLARRQTKELIQSRSQANLEKGYARGEGYVSQSQAALNHVRQRTDKQRAQAGLVPKRPKDANEPSREELKKIAEALRGANNSQEPDKAQKRDDGRRAGRFDTKEMTDAQRAKMERLLGSSDRRERSRDRTEDDTDRQRGAPDGGRTRSR